MKLFFHDLSQLDQLYRIVAFIVVAVIAILASFLYQRFLTAATKNNETNTGYRPHKSSAHFIAATYADLRAPCKVVLTGPRILPTEKAWPEWPPVLDSEVPDNDAQCSDLALRRRLRLRRR